jgi:hypothetical protein
LKSHHALDYSKTITCEGLITNTIAYLAVLLLLLLLCCRCSGGGIIVASTANVTLRELVVHNNTAQYDGGGLVAAGASEVRVTLSRCTAAAAAAATAAAAVTSCVNLFRAAICNADMCRCLGCMSISKTLTLNPAQSSIPAVAVDGAKHQVTSSLQLLQITVHNTSIAWNTVAQSCVLTDGGNGGVCA